jgi:hypothetical protein
MRGRAAPSLVNSRFAIPVPRRCSGAALGDNNPMKITEIVSSESVVRVDGHRSIAFRTHPPLPEEVWKKFCEAGHHGNLWEKCGDLLVWVGPNHLTDTIVNETEQRLTLMENELQNQQNRATDMKQKYLEQISKQTGRPVA